MPEGPLIIFSHIHAKKINTPAQDPSYTAKTTAELCTFLGPVSDKLKSRAKRLVIVCKKFNQGNFMGDL